MIQIVLPLIVKRTNFIGTLGTTRTIRRYKCSIPEKMINLQKKFQEKNNVPIHLKGGAKDKLLYLTTMGLTGCGLFYTMIFLAGYIIND
ncbi:cytochrome c oxidase subunit 7A2, mitochondrial-like [Haematobia irritans]|uniref:cytochrome c oxidase subunit 7A2, mitochondrial-like n=1 Tax=Haematobia irritans TaxID=7368 RepID=UPI003F50A34C